MSQNVVDYSLNPTGPELLDDYLDKEQENNLTSNSGIQRPSYAQACTLWVDNSATPWTWYFYDGTNDIAIGTFNSTTHEFISANFANVVNLTTAQNVAGVKTFTDKPLVPTPTSADNVATVANLAYVAGIQQGLQTAIDGKQATITGAASTVTGSNLTADRALVSNSSGKIAASSITSTELGYLSDVTSNIQAQINNKSEKSLTVGFPDYSNKSVLSKSNGTVQATGWLLFQGASNTYEYSITIGSTTFSISDAYGTRDVLFIPVMTGDTYSCSSWGYISNLYYLPNR